MNLGEMRVGFFFGGAEGAFIEIFSICGCRFCLKLWFVGNFGEFLGGAVFSSGHLLQKIYIVRQKSMIFFFV